MSEKQFTTKNIICSNYCVWDNNDKPYGNDELVIFLNEQLSIIRRNELSMKTMMSNMEKLEKENKQLREKNKQIRYLKRDLFILINLIRDTPMESNYDFEKIVERWE